MQESPKGKRESDQEPKGKGEPGDDPCWAEDLGYYYDDTHGYEKYDPEADDEGEDEESEAASEDL